MTWSARSAWIIGASTGIGAALAQQLAALGCDVTVSARSADALNEVSQGKMNVRPCDIQDLEGLRAIALELNSQGKLDLVVIAAGYWKQDQGLEFNRVEFERHLDVNLRGVGNVLDVTLPTMRETNRGHIAVLSSVAGYRGMPGALAYGSTKAAQINLFEALRTTYRGTGVLFQTVSPGFVETPMTAANTFPMPFIINSDKAATYIVRGLQTQKPEIVFPWKMAFVMKLAKLVPQRLWLRLVGKK
jgi:short-subunit dehydrogenase